MEKERDFCKPITGSNFFSDSDLKKATKITLFEKMCLWFIKPKYAVSKIENHTLKYKMFRGKMYIIDHWINPPITWNCRSQILPNN